jgi:hypothetical protein
MTRCRRHRVRTTQAHPNETAGPGPGRKDQNSAIAGTPELKNCCIPEFDGVDDFTVVDAAVKSVDLTALIVGYLRAHPDAPPESAFALPHVHARSVRRWSAAAIGIIVCQRATVRRGAGA